MNAILPHCSIKYPASNAIKRTSNRTTIVKPAFCPAINSPFFFLNVPLSMRAAVAIKENFLFNPALLYYNRQHLRFLREWIVFLFHNQNKISSRLSAWACSGSAFDRIISAKSELSCNSGQGFRNETVQPILRSIAARLS